LLLFICPEKPKRDSSLKHRAMGSVLRLRDRASRKSGTKEKARSLRSE
jgi:hypothetical protein